MPVYLRLRATLRQAIGYRIFTILVEMVVLSVFTSLSTPRSLAVAVALGVINTVVYIIYHYFYRNSQDFP